MKNSPAVQRAKTERALFHASNCALVRDGYQCDCVGAGAGDTTDDDPRCIKNGQHIQHCSCAAFK